MSAHLEHTESAVKLLLLAMSPRLSPGNNGDYGDLLSLYSKDPDFRQIVQAAARGMKVSIYTSSPQHGLMLLPIENGFFSPTMESFKKGLAFRERVAFGVLHYALAAYAFPSQEALADDIEVLGPRVTVNEVAKFAREFCDQLKVSTDEKEAMTEEMIEGFNHLLSLRERDEGSTKNIAAMLKTILDRYEREGLFSMTEEDGETIYRARAQFRAQARFMMREADNGLMDRLQQFRAKEATK
jgi:hypothetical protein